MADITEKMDALGKQAVKLRDKDGLPWHEVAGEMGLSTGKAILAYEFGKVKPADRVTARNDAELGTKIVKLRDKDGLSWGRISARTGRGEQQCRSLYTEASGQDHVGNRIGKGGRYPGGASKAPRKAGGAKKAPAKKSVAKKAAATKKAVGPRKAGGTKKAVAKKAGGVKKSARKAAASPAGGTTTSGGRTKGKALVDMDYDEISERLEGRRIGVQVGDSERRNTYTVQSVRSLEGDHLAFLDAKTGNVRNVRVSGIKVVSK